jgi:UDP-GlcNAc:undecaprenyl-phosphate GlcNAc-1-phosphate transferase
VNRTIRGRRTGLGAALLGGGVAAAAARAAYVALNHTPPGGQERWARTNHRGEQLTLLEGPALAVGAITGSLVTPGLPGRARAVIALAGAGAAGFGGYDDLAGNSASKGFRGHLGALAHGELTSGAVKLGGIGATGGAASALIGGAPADLVINAGLIAGAANLMNLFDLRPGRAIKVALAAATLTGAASARGRAAVAAPAGAAAELLLGDLGERAMLGDAGANALGAMLGAAAAATLPRGARLGALAVVTGLTAASEVVSFTKVIERTPPLHWLDMLGRRAPSPAPDSPAPDSPASESPVPENPGPESTVPADPAPAVPPAAGP